jgi:SagB-type dehydrogenase family enzyme
VATTSASRFRRVRPFFLAYTNRAMVAISGNSRLVPVNDAVVRTLDALEDWSTIDDIARRLGGLLKADVHRLMQSLAANGLVERETKRPSRVRTDVWDALGPAAAALHFTTRLERYATTPQPVEAALREKYRVAPPPPPVLRRSGKKTRLPPPRTDSPVSRALLERRTWRFFGKRPVEASELSDLLWLTFGVQHWAETDGQGRVPLKTSPSGGACHPIEAYVLVHRVRGVQPGFYHYESDRHRLTTIRAGAQAATLRACVQAQPWLGEASFLVFMCPVFARTAWRYPSSRAYRSILIEAGHLGQTFCVLAAHLGLAPFCTLAIDDPHVDRQLGVNGVDQGVIYLVGAGTAPPGGFRAGVPFKRSQADG